MRRTVTLLALAGAILLACTGVVLAQTSAPDDEQPSAEEGQAQPTDFVSSEILVKFKDRASEAKKQEAHGKKGGRAKGTIRGIDVQVVDVPSGKEKSKAKEYNDDPEVEFAEVNGLQEAVQTVNDPGATEQWQYNNTQYTTANRGDIDAYEAWNGGSTTAWDGGTTGSSSVAIAVLDTGIKEDHEDLTGKVTERVNYTTSSTNSDVRGHGTHVAGSAAALTNNGKGVAGTCPGCTLYNVKVLGDTGRGSYDWTSKGITWAADNGADVINMSLGGSGYSYTQQAAVEYAWSKGAVIVAAAGNDNTSTPFYPAAYDNVIAVGATDKNDAKASFSNYGSSWVDVAAPGAGILSTTVGGGYGRQSGTSMASPLVAGEAGLVWSKSGLCAPADNACVLDQIEGKTNPISGSGTYWAKGRVNANCAVSTTASEQCDTKAPTVGTVTPTSGQTGVQRNADVTATFSEEMSSGTITESTVQLYQKYWYQVRKKKGKKVRRVWTYRWVPVGAGVSCDSACRTVTLDPSSDLVAHTDHMALITTGAKDEAGNALIQNHSWTFTIGSN